MDDAYALPQNKKRQDPNVENGKDETRVDLGGGHGRSVPEEEGKKKDDAQDERGSLEGPKAYTQGRRDEDIGKVLPDIPYWQRTILWL